jgi:colanic acid biosynthesis glycosyl transferase WcaI
MAEYLASLGAEVHVITGFPHYPAWRIAPGYRRAITRRERVNGVDILRLRHTVPSTMTVARRAGYEGTFLLHSLLRASRLKPDVVIAISPALGSAVAGSWLSRRAQAPLITVVQDLMAKATGESGIAGGGRAAGIAGSIEGHALRSSNHVFVVADSFRKALRQYGIPNDKITLLRNWTHITPATASRTEARRALGWPLDMFLAVHTGNMGFKQQLENVVSAAQVIGAEADIMFVLVGDGSQRAALQKLARSAPSVKFVDPVTAEMYPLTLAAADVLLVNERESVADMSLPSKLTSYFAARRPVLAAVAEGGATWHELHNSGAAVIVPANRPAALARAVIALKADTEAQITLGEAGSRFASENLTPAVSMAALRDLINSLTQPVMSPTCADGL